MTPTKTTTISTSSWSSWPWHVQFCHGWMWHVTHVSSLTRLWWSDTVSVWQCIYSPPGSLTVALTFYSRSDYHAKVNKIYILFVLNVKCFSCSQTDGVSSNQVVTIFSCHLATITLIGTCLAVLINKIISRAFSRNGSVLMQRHFILCMYLQIPRLDWGVHWIRVY